MSTPNPQQASSAANAAQTARNTLHLSAPELEKIRAFLLQSHRTGGGSARRKYRRWPFPHDSLLVELRQTSGMTTPLEFAAVDISADGVGLLHSKYVTVGTACIVHLPDLTGGSKAIEGVVVRCRHVRGTLHDFGVRFTQPIRLREHTPLDPFEGRFTLEKVDIESLHGSILHVEDSAVDRQLLRYFLKECELNVVTADSCDAAMKRADEGFDIIILNANMGDGDGYQLLDKMRAAGVQTPTIIVSADDTQAARDRARAAKANAFLSKPIDGPSLIRGIAEFLIVGGMGLEGGGALYSTISPEDPRAGLLGDFADEMKKAAEKLNEAIKSGDVEVVRRVCLQVKGAAPSLGFEPLGTVAEQCLKAVVASMSVAESLKQCKSLASACSRVRVKGARRAA